MGKGKNGKSLLMVEQTGFQERGKSNKKGEKQRIYEKHTKRGKTQAQAAKDRGRGCPNQGKVQTRVVH